LYTRQLELLGKPFGWLVGWLVVGWLVVGWLLVYGVQSHFSNNISVIS
jgi:hypothetical protein